ncbi:hypothetical protein [Mumia zhuanghuii]|uniref:Uncharacterized protein n=1 Tax=Mumia zhuanghuii TaxID=2585211 RepID=A0A5C4M9S9_9ACTN|nr:hypothetical protein [Mumia zhuanghuii]TNC31280.1 hypothetical protein FHE65_31905 [Mumia zhuanghuii]
MEPPSSQGRPQERAHSLVEQRHVPVSLVVAEEACPRVALRELAKPLQCRDEPLMRGCMRADVLRAAWVLLDQRRSVLA